MAAKRRVGQIVNYYPGLTESQVGSCLAYAADTVANLSPKTETAQSVPLKYLADENCPGPVIRSL